MHSFGGIGLALSVFANSAAAQDGRDGRRTDGRARRETRRAADSPRRRTSCSRPEPRRGRHAGRVALALFGTPVAGTPVPGSTVIVPPSGGVIYRAPVNGSIVGQPMGPMGPMVSSPMAQPAKPITGGAPSVTESRNAAASPRPARHRSGRRMSPRSCRAGPTSFPTG